MIQKIKLVLELLKKGEKKFMEDKMDKMRKLEVKIGKETENYIHYDLDGVDKNDLDPETCRTVCLPNGNKLITAKNTKTGETVGFSMLLKKGKADDK